MNIIHGEERRCGGGVCTIALKNYILVCSNVVNFSSSFI